MHCYIYIPLCCTPAEQLQKSRNKYQQSTYTRMFKPSFPKLKKYVNVCAAPQCGCTNNKISLNRDARDDHSQKHTHTKIENQKLHNVSPEPETAHMSSTQSKCKHKHSRNTYHDNTCDNICVRLYAARTNHNRRPIQHFVTAMLV